MASQNTKSELKLSKRMFAPPVAKSSVLIAKGEPELLSKQEDAQQKESALSHATVDGAETKVTHYPKVTTKDQRWKESSSIENEVNHGKDPDVNKNEEGCLTDAQFEEIVQSVLQKSLQECLGVLRCNPNQLSSIKVNAVQLQEYSGKRLAMVESAEEESQGRETLETSPTAGDAVPGKVNRGKGEVMFLEAKQKKHLTRTKENTELPVNKDRKEKNEKPEADNGGCKENRKGVPKKKVQGNARITVGLEEMQEEEEADRGSGCSWYMVWVQCSYPSCEKWRKLNSDIDPSVLPEDWSCSQNPDLQHNSCSIPEETYSGSENEVVYAVYIPGSIVWAKQYGYPWWPGMVEADPDIGEYFLFSSQNDSLPSKYHVTFFGDFATRAWISASMLRNFDDPDVEGHCLTKLKSKCDKKNLKTAVRMAEEAEKINLQERMKKFGFDNRFSGREPSNDQQDLKDVVMCKPCSKRTLNSGGRNKKTTTSDKNQEKKTTNIKGPQKSKRTTEGSFSLSKRSRKDVSPPTDAAVSQGAGKRREHQGDQKGFKKSFAVPLLKNPSSSTDSSGNQNKKDSLKKVKASHVAECKAVLTKSVVGLEESNGSMAAMNDEEGGFGSQERIVFAEEKNDSLEDFALDYFKE